MMDWLEKLRTLKAQSGISMREIAAKSGIPEPTLEKIFAGVTKSPGINTIQSLVHALGYTLTDIDSGSNKKNSSAAEAAPENKKAPLYSSEAMKLVQDYDSLDSYGKRMVRMVVIEEKVRCEEQREAPAPNMIYAAAKDGGRPESEADCKIVLPEEDTQIPR